MSTEEIKIIGIIKEGVTLPKNDGSPRSALYSIPFELSKVPSYEWCSFFLEAWRHPSTFSSMHRPSIASVEDNLIILNGTTIEEVEKNHKETLLKAIEIANQKEKEYFQQKDMQEESRKSREAKQREDINSKIDKIGF